MLTDKWADFLIAKVEYNPEETHIQRVLVYEDKGDTLGSSSEQLRSEVVTNLKSGKKYMTIYKAKDKDNKDVWKKGAEVYIITIKNQEFIKTVRDETPKDNLGELPRF
jgi:hypothetical protein